jgi:hypothetical protein
MTSLKIGQNVAQIHLGQNFYTAFAVEKSSPKRWSNFVFLKNCQRKQSPNRQKFVQSGHSVQSWRNKGRALRTSRQTDTEEEIEKREIFVPQSTYDTAHWLDPYAERSFTEDLYARQVITPSPSLLPLSLSPSLQLLFILKSVCRN